MGTLREMKARGEGLVLHCDGRVGARCSHSHFPSIDQLIQYFGVDFDVVAERCRFLSRFVCEVCGTNEATIRLTHGKGVHGIDRAAGHRSTEAYVSVDESTRRYLVLFGAIV